MAAGSSQIFENMEGIKCGKNQDQPSQKEKSTRKKITKKNLCNELCHLS